jgi:hypothetical protein
MSGRSYILGVASALFKNADSELSEATVDQLQTVRTHVLGDACFASRMKTDANYGSGLFLDGMAWLERKITDRGGSIA